MDSHPGSRRRILVVDDDRGLSLALSTLLTDAGHDVASTDDGPDALALLRQRAFDIVLLDVGLPTMSGLDVLAQARALPTPPRIIMMTADDTPETVLESVRGQAFRYVRKPFPPNAIVEIVSEVLGSAGLSFEVVSARPEWLELVAPCSIEMAERIHSFVMHLDAHLPEDVREAVAYAFRELLMNAVEWGGKLDANRKVRISCIRTRKMLLYKIADPGEGFDIDGLMHAAISHPGDPIKHLEIREEKGIRPGGFGLALTRSLVDELIYNEARNEVIFVKYLEVAQE
jgi:CheY-like chemotaxis protein/anti-sigma regulatory factor (Ser/Thr protein kinase)